MLRNMSKPMPAGIPSKSTGFYRFSQSYYYGFGRFWSDENGNPQS